MTENDHDRCAHGSLEPSHADWILTALPLILAAIASIFVASGWQTLAFTLPAAAISALLARRRLITPMRAMQRQVVEAKATVAAMADAALDSVITTDERGIVVEFNRPAETTFGHRRRDVLGRQIGEVIVPPELRAAHDAGMQRYVATGEGHVIGRRVEVTGLHASGRTFPVELAISEVRLPQRRLFTAYLRDITGRQARDQQNALFAMALDQSADSVEITGPDHRLIYVNAAFEQLTGYSRAEALGKTPAEVLRSDHHAPAFFQEIESTIARGEVWHGRIVSRHKSGRKVFQDMSVSPLRDDEGHLTNFVAIKRDVADQERMEQALLASEQRSRALTETHPVPLMIVDLEKAEVIYASPAFHGLMGYPPGSLPGRSTHRFFVEPSDRTTLIETLRSRGALDMHEVRHKRANGEVFWAGVTSRLTEFEGVGAAVVALTDLTERKAAAAEIEQQREALHQQEKLSALGSLLAGVAHELNNPLSVVVGHAALLRESTADEKSKERAERIHAAAGRCARIVKTFLAMARQKPQSFGPVDVNAMIEGALDIAAYTLRTTDVRLERHLASGLLQVWGDSDQLHQVIVNLVINAQQALEQCTAPRHLRVETATGAGGEVRIEIEDNGPGMPDEIRKRIFEPFYTTKTEGSGIGLAICLGIVEAHGGRIEVATRPSQGTLVTIHLPGHAAEAADHPATTMPAPGEAAGGRILLVEDETEVAALLVEVLGADGHSVRHAISGRAALDLLAENPFDLIISDLKMPDLDGPGLYRRLEEERPELLDRLIFVTGDTLGRHARQFLEQTARLVIEKPFDLALLRSKVRQVLDSNGRAADRPPPA
jgi:nitrogen fixation negative regulator NifL